MLTTAEPAPAISTALIRCAARCARRAANRTPQRERGGKVGEMLEVVHRAMPDRRVVDPGEMRDQQRDDEARRRSDRPELAQIGSAASARHGDPAVAGSPELGRFGEREQGRGDLDEHEVLQPCAR